VTTDRTSESTIGDGNRGLYPGRSVHVSIWTMHQKHCTPCRIKRKSMKSIVSICWRSDQIRKPICRSICIIQCRYAAAIDTPQVYYGDRLQADNAMIQVQHNRWWSHAVGCYILSVSNPPSKWKDKLRRPRSL